MGNRIFLKKSMCDLFIDNKKNTSPRYFVTQSHIGDYINWRVVKEDYNSRGMKVFSFVCGYPTQRAAVSIAHKIVLLS
tara:strand:+ start:3721 stop:3954 length:234 start_codon:yes stop_codon:yes gene_type:complete